jgi:uncharacterized Tic20 family protein
MDTPPPVQPPSTPAQPPPISAPPPALSAGPRGSDKIWAILSHLSALVGFGLVLPAVVYLAMRKESEYVASNAREALNFHLSLLLYGLCCVPLIFIVIGIPLLVLICLLSLVLAIVAAIKASDGACYRYPLSIRFVS